MADIMLQHLDTDDLICPYCDKRQPEIEELIGDGIHHYKCTSCDEEFAFEVRAEITYSSWKEDE